ncbi:hypothetical protein [Thermostichus vulcanus]|uniref:Uncharacterized protein n=1 Tax=Thermostichus vulcanus str. 'Rupite' TaxID=2813851 RepID=A0ABT0C7B6_THEVL|nr:hypothetical protein [Thermostichus vulcanus]MCJ2541680.1 hypothetical protein [Thermostichus vulcanus str. 'Rupite']
MTFAGDQDSTRDPNLPSGNREEERKSDSTREGAMRPPSYSRGDGFTPGEGRRTPPPLPDRDPHQDPLSEGRRTGSAGGSADDWLDSGRTSGTESSRASGTESFSPRAGREPRETAMGSGSPRSTERSSPSRSGQALVPRRPAPSSRAYEGSESARSTYANPYRRESRYRSDYSRSAASGYTSSYVDGGGFGTGAGSGGSRGGLSPSGLTVVALVALLAFFGGFAIRNIFAESGGFDDERPIRAANVPEAFREFCFAYNGTASFTVVELTSVSALTMASVPIYKMDTCTIPVSQTANALQALGIRGRADTLGPQLGGSNLTLIELPLASGLARAIYNQFPALANQGNEAQVLSQLESTINSALRSNIEGLALQSLEATNIPDVYVMVPGHSFNLQPQLNLR